MRLVYLTILSLFIFCDKILAQDQSATTAAYKRKRNRIGKRKCN